MKHILPLYSFYNKLQNHTNYSLGIGEYSALLQVLEKDVGNRYFKNPEKMFELCKLLWFKPQHNQRLFRKLYNESFRDLNDELPEEDEQGKQEGPQTQDSDVGIPNNYDVENKIQNEEVYERKSNDESVENKNEHYDKPTNKNRLFLNFEEGIGEGKSSITQDYKKNFDFVNGCSLMNDRETIQSWRYLRRKEATKKCGDFLDIPTTINSFAKNGVLLKPNFKTQSIIKASLITFIDLRGSMRPFKNLALNLASSTRKVSGIGNETYFFRNSPQAFLAGNDERELYVFKDQSQICPISLNRIFTGANKFSGIMIISDAGAISKDVSLDRIESTENFLSKLYQFSIKVAWLNPAPEDRWENTSAHFISKLVDMFEANNRGLKSAIAIFRGKKKSNSNILFPHYLDYLF